MLPESVTFGASTPIKELQQNFAFAAVMSRYESLRVLTPRGIIETRRLPGSGGGPSPDRLLIVGSEGILGIITQAWMRLQDRLKFRSAELCSLQPLL